MDKIGFIGLGKMGSGICNALLANGYEGTVYDVNPAASGKYEGKARVANSVSEVIRKSDYIFLSLPSSRHVEPVIDEFLKEGVKEKTIIDLSTSYPFSTKQLYEKVKAGGGAFIDAPLSGSPADAEKGTLCVLFGGDRDQFEKLETMMKCFCNRYFYLGESGSGAVAKLMMNFISLSYVIAYAHVFPLTEKMGLDNSLLYDIISGSAMNCGMFRLYAPKMISRSYDMAFAFELALKDLTYCKKLFEEYEVPAFGLDGTLDLLRVGIKDGRGKKDYSECAAVMYDFFEGK
jgi:3-hydroxyisobutyrate dehydrogenase-like beta-hydroxyacid dehydrogenase